MITVCDSRNDDDSNVTL